MLRANRTYRFAFSIYLAFFSILGTVQAQGIQGVHVWGGEDGQGVLRARGSECFVITPKHVIEKIVGPNIRIKTGNLVSATGERSTTFSLDLAIVKVHPGVTLPCTEWLPIENFEAMLAAMGTGHLSIVDESGQRSLVRVSLRTTDLEYIWIEREDGLSFRAGMSGSPLFANGALLGLFLGIDSDGTGRVLRTDTIMRLTEAFFEPTGNRPSFKTGIEVATAQEILERVVASRNWSRQGQVEAIEALHAAGLDFVGADLGGISLAAANLRGASMQHAFLQAVDLTSIRMEDAILNEANLRFSTLEGINATGVKMQRALATFVRGTNANFVDADLSGANFMGADLRGADFSGANLTGTAFAFADLTGASLNAADLTGAYLSGAIMDKVDWTDAIIRETDFSAAVGDWEGMTSDQRSGACRQSLPRIEEEYPVGGFALAPRFQIIEQFPSDRFSTGYEFNRLPSKAASPGVVYGRSLPVCASDPEAAAGYHAVYNEGLTFRMDRNLLQAMNRESQFQEYLGHLVERINATLDYDRTLKDEERVMEWRNALDESDPPAKPVHEPYLGWEYRFLKLIAFGVTPESEYRWQIAARSRFEDERELRQGEKNEAAAWAPIFPPESTLLDLGPRALERFRNWTENRVAEIGNRARQRRSISRYRVTEDGFYRPFTSRLTENTTEEEQMWAETHSLVEDRFWFVGYRTLLVMEESRETYALRLPKEVIESSSDQTVLEISYQLSHTELKPEDNNDRLVFHAKPLVGRVLLGEDTLWEGNFETVPFTE